MHPPDADDQVAPATSSQPGPGDRARGLVDSYLPHAAGALAIAAVVLYALGVVMTLGQLRATDLDQARGLALIPLEDHLRNGIGIASSGIFVFLVAVFALMYFGARATFAAHDRQKARASESEPAEQPSDTSEDEENTDHDERDEGRDANSDGATARSSVERATAAVDWFERRVAPIVVAVLFVAIGLTSPWPIVIVLLIIAGAWILHAWIRVSGGPWSRRPAELYILILAIALIIIAAGDAYFRANPLPYGVAVTPERRVKGPVIGTDRGVLYLAPADGKGLYTGLAVEQITELKVRKQKREQERTPLDFISDLF